MQQRLVVAGLKLVGANQKTVWIGLNLVDYILRREAVQAGLCHLGPTKFMFA